MNNVNRQVDDSIAHLENYSNMLKAQAAFIDSHVTLLRGGRDIAKMFDAINPINFFGKINADHQ